MEYILFGLMGCNILFTVVIVLYVREAEEDLWSHIGLLTDIIRNLEQIELLMSKKITKK